MGVIPLIGCLYAGGQGRRMGGRDKAEIKLGGKPLWQLAIDRLTPFVTEMIVTAPHQPVWTTENGAPRHVPDWLHEGMSVGPVGGLLAALREVKDGHGAKAMVFTVPVDAPFFPEELLTLLPNAIEKGAKAAIATSPSRLQPAFGAWSVACLDPLMEAVSAGERALHVLADQVQAEKVRFEDEVAFFNINTAEDLQQAEIISGSPQ